MSDKSNRPSPSVSATLFALGTQRTGNDGNMWVIKQTPKGVKRWVRDINAVPISAPQTSTTPQTSTRQNYFLLKNGVQIIEDRQGIVRTLEFELDRTKIKREEVENLVENLKYTDGVNYASYKDNVNNNTNINTYTIDILLFKTISTSQEVALFKNIERILDDYGYGGKTITTSVPSALTNREPIFGVNLSGEMYYYIYDVFDKDLNDESNSFYLCSLSPTEKKEHIMRELFFVKGDVISYELNGYNYESFVTNIYEDNDGEIQIELENTFNKEIETLSFIIDFREGIENIKIIQYYKLWERFDNPVLITKKEEVKEKNQVDKGIEDEIKSLNKQIADLVFLRSLLLPIDFEKKIDFGQRIAERQKQLSELNFKLVERRLGSKDIFDELFEQSFTEVKHSYTDNYSKSDYGDYFTPNGEKSKLSDELNIMIRTPEFIQWFGDWELAYLYKDTNAQISCSKIIDSNYEPLLVWHGTGAEFSYFKFDNFPATYFAKKKAYSEWFADLHGGGEGYTIPFFLNIRNPLDLRGFGTRKIKAKEFFDYIFLKTGLDMDMLEINPIFTSSNYPPNETWVYLRNNAKMLKKLSESKIHDGIMFFETNPSVPLDKEAHDTEAYIIFEANQCKVASTDRGMLLLSSLKSFLLKKGGQI
jgi:hypothetical protein